MPGDKPYSDQELLLRIIRGDEAAMQTVFEQYFARLCYFAQKLTGGNKEEAEDIVQEAMLNLWINVKEKGAGVISLEAYLFQMVRNRCYNFNKREKMRAEKAGSLLKQAPLSDNEVEQELMREDLFNKIYQELMALPPQQAEIMRMIFVDGLDTNEIAGRLRLTPNNIRNHKARAIEKVRAFILKKGPFILLVIYYYYFINLL